VALGWWKRGSGACKRVRIRPVGCAAGTGRLQEGLAALW